MAAYSIQAVWDYFSKNLALLNRANNIGGKYGKQFNARTGTV